MKRYIVIHIHGFDATLYYFQSETEIPYEELNSEAMHNSLIDLLSIQFNSPDYCDDNESLVVEKLPEFNNLPKFH